MILDSNNNNGEHNKLAGPLHMTRSGTKPCTVVVVLTFKCIVITSNWVQTIIQSWCHHFHLLSVSPRNHRLHRRRHWPPPSSTPPPPLATSSSSSLPILSIFPSSPSPSCLSAPSSSPRILSTPPVRGSDSSSLRATERAGVLNQKINREKSIAALNRRERDGVNAILSPCHTCLARGGS